MFTPDLFQFLEDLAVNNDRTWFGLNKPRYEATVREPALAFIEALGPLLREQVSPHLRVSRSSMFRIHRDTRFSKDKRPYKTHVGLHFPHGGAPTGDGRGYDREVREDVHRPGYYLHLEPGNSFAACGMWHPSNDLLYKIRQAIVDDEDAWRAFKDEGHNMEGDSLKRPPAGFPKNHPYIEDLMRKDFVIARPLKENEICDSKFVHRFVEECRRTVALMRFLCTAVELPWDSRLQS